MGFLTDEQVTSKVDFIKAYAAGGNAASCSKVDANANVTEKNIATLQAELYKDATIQVNRKLICDLLEKRFGKSAAESYLDDLKKHNIYTHDESSINPYCASLSMYPFLADGLTTVGGESKAPTNLDSYCGSFINLVFAASSQFAGACMHRDQTIVIRRNGYIEVTTVNKLLGDSPVFSGSFNFDGVTWETQKVSGMEIWEDGKFVPLNKLYRRLYDKKIYTITTHTGRTSRVSADHKFKVLFRGRVIEVKASELRAGDTVYLSNHVEFPVDKNSDDYKKGQLLGIIAGDGCITDPGVIRVAIHFQQRFISDALDALFLKFYGVAGELRPGHKCFDYQLRDKRIAAAIRAEFSGKSFYSYDKNVDMTNATLEFQAGFLDGVMVTDGGFNHSATITLSNKALIETLSNILTNLGAYHSYAGIDPIGNRKPGHKLTIRYRDLIPYTDLYQTKYAGNSRMDSIKEERAYYYGSHAFKYSTSATYTVANKISAANQSEVYYTDVVDDITFTGNDHPYVYEVETETHWYSCGGIITHNCATVEWLVYMDHFAEKSFGNGYMDNQDAHKELAQCFQQVVYTMNQPAASRGYQSVFWNISIFDRYFFDGMFGTFYFPDGTQPSWESVDKLQRFFIAWFREERKKALLTFPVVTLAALTEGNTWKDQEYLEFAAEEFAKGSQFFIYTSPTVDSLSSCCRLRNAVQDNTFSYTLGAGGIMTGSKNVITINMNRVIQTGVNLEQLIDRVHMYQVAHNDLYEWMYENNLLTVYKAGFINLKKQYLTLGINGVVEAAEYLGYEISNNQEYKEWLAAVLGTFKRKNQEGGARYGVMFNTECVPAENLGVKNAAWDRKDGLQVRRDVYNSYFYKVEDDRVSLFDKMQLHGGEILENLDGGSALHFNNKEVLSVPQYKAIFNALAVTGSNFFGENVERTCCNTCGYIHPNNVDKCPKCGSTELDYATRIIGYLKLIRHFSDARKTEAAKRHLHDKPSH